MSVVSLNHKRFKKISTYQNNCALGSGVGLLIDELNLVADDVIDTTDSRLFAWKKKFIEFYQLDPNTPLNSIRKIFKKFPNVQDQQVLLAPVLRTLLQEIHPDLRDFIFLKAEEAADLFHLLGISLSTYTKAESQTDKYVKDDYPARSELKKLEIVHTANYDGNGGLHWEAVATDEAQAEKHNLEFDAKRLLQPYEKIPDLKQSRSAIQQIVQQEAFIINQKDSLTQLKAKWLARVNQVQTDSNTRGVSTGVQYSYMNNNQRVTFFTDANTQSKLDDELAVIIARDNDAFADLPRFS